MGEAVPRDSSNVDLFRLNPDTSALVTDIQRDKYMQPKDRTWAGAHRRVAKFLFADDAERAVDLERELSAGRACPAGRVLAGAGSGKNVTLWNCFVSPLLQDSMRTDPAKLGKGIMDALADVAFSMQMGGGVGTDFSPLRPTGALVSRVGAEASGPLSFMDMWDAMCRTIMSAGYRRGAMMATLRIDHPDIVAFIHAKRDPLRLRMFNVSVLVLDAFMDARDADEEWELGHWEPPFDKSKILTVRQKPLPGTDEPLPWYVYQRVSARALWQEIMESTYHYAEPGVIFIDRINKFNNLWYCEHIQCTNPCGEQPLPPDQNCCLSHNNLSRCTSGDPFTNECFVDVGVVERTTRLLIRMSDRVIDLSPAPTEAQRLEALRKRRIGLGITGLANMLMFLRQRYGSPEAVETTQVVMRVIRDASYRESIELAKEHGPFPAFDRDLYLKGEFIKTLPEDIRQGIAEHGIRNALLNTVAPTGTVSIAQADNSSGGLEPVFLARYVRKVLQPDNSFKESTVEDLGFRVYANARFDGDFDAAMLAPIPDYMVTTAGLTPHDHLVMQATVQRYIDSSVSKTINVPTDTKLDDFVGIYDQAYVMGCKGCTTYREVPDSGRGSVLSAVKNEAPAPAELRTRPEVLDGRTYRLRWSSLPYPMFLTVNDEVLPDGRRIPYEVFINSKAVDYAHWVSALTRTISAVMRKGGDLSFLPEELKAVWSARGGEFIGERFVPSEVALIGLTLERHFREIGYISTHVAPEAATPEEIGMTGAHYAELGIGEECPSCGALQVIRAEGCKKCIACEWSNCG